MRRVSCFFLAGCLITFSGFAGCASAPTKPSIEEFTQQVLFPLANQKSDEVIELAKANLTETYLEQERQIREKAPKPASDLLLRGFGFVFGGVGSLGAEAVINMDNQRRKEEANNRKAEYEEHLLWLDTRKIPTRNEILQIFKERTTETDFGFSVCVSGKEFLYEIRDGRFIKVGEGDSSCPSTEVQSIKRPPL